MAIMVNKRNKSATTIDTATNTYTLANFQGVGETVSGLNINQIVFSSNGTWTVARGANTVAVLVGNGHWNLSGMGIPITKDSTANISVTLSASSVGSIMLEVRKDKSATDYV